MNMNNNTKIINILPFLNERVLEQDGQGRGCSDPSNSKPPDSSTFEPIGRCLCLNMKGKDNFTKSTFLKKRNRKIRAQIVYGHVSTDRSRINLSNVSKIFIQ